LRWPCTLPLFAFSRVAMAETNKIELQFTVNGTVQTVRTYPLARLLDVLREELRLTGAKEGCGEGECGACSVMLNGALVNSCLVPVLQANGAKITTIEGVATNEKLHPVQQAFLKHGGAQCGICTPGMVLAAISLLEDCRQRGVDPGDAEIRSGLAGNLCRCTGYMKIFESVVAACKEIATEAQSERIF
jgi:carbon-monoxide dehydrogenase small subunit